MSDKYEIFSPAFSANSLRATGFKSTHYALAELIDNSVQSAIEDKKKRCNVEVIAIDKEQKLSKILVIDDAGGMSPEILRQSLGVGRGRALEENKKKSGKRKNIKVWSWFETSFIITMCKIWSLHLARQRSFMSYLDNNELDSGKLKYVPEPIKKTYLMSWKKLSISKIRIWNLYSLVWYVSKSTWKTSYGLMKNAEIEFGRMYRHLLMIKL